MKHTEFGHSITFISQDWVRHQDFTHRNKADIGNYDADSEIELPGRLHMDRNTWESWGLVPNSRPTLPHPSQKTNILQDVQNINGEIDLSWAMVPYPVFGNREGSFTFIYNPLHQLLYNKMKPWTVLYSEISEFIHGKKLRMVLEDDPGYYYEGRFWVDSWESNNDGSGSTITISYSVEPYKVSILSSLDEWIWDPFSFYTGTISSEIFKMHIARDYSDPNNILKKEQYHDIIHTGENSSFWYGNSTPNTRLDLFGLVGTKPQIPVIYWKPTYNDLANRNNENEKIKRSLIVNYVNFAHNIDYGKSGIRYKYFDPIGSHGQNKSISSKGVELISGTNLVDGYYTFKDLDMIFCDNYMSSYQFIQFIGDGDIKIEFHRGSL